MICILQPLFGDILLLFLQELKSLNHLTAKILERIRIFYNLHYQTAEVWFLCSLKLFTYELKHVNKYYISSDPTSVV